MEEQFFMAKFIEINRKKMGLTQAQVAVIIGYPRTTYQDREKGISLDISFFRDFSERVMQISFTEFFLRYDEFLRAEKSSIRLSSLQN